MSDQIKTPPFLSLRWKTLISATLLVVVILSLFGWHLHRRHQQSLNDIIADLRLKNIELLENNIQRNGERWQRHISQLSLFATHAAENFSGDLTGEKTLNQLSVTLEKDWPELSDNAGVSEMWLLDAELNIEHRWLNSKDEVEISAAWLNNFEETSTPTLFCRQQCWQVIHKDLFHNDRRLASVFIFRSLEYLFSSFASEHPKYVGVLELKNLHRVSETPSQETSSEDVSTDQSNNDSYVSSNISSYRWQLEIWQASLLSYHQPPEFERILKQTSQHYSHADLAGRDVKVTLDNRQYSVGILPIRGANNHNLRFILVNDISKEHQHIVKNLLQDSVVALTLLLVLGIYLCYSVWGYLRRINLQLQVLPMLGQKQYHEVRNIISKSRSFHFYHDEFDHLDNSVTALTYQLESLERAVSHRTKEMERLSLFDSLTGLANRSLLLYELQRDVQRFQRQGGMLAVVILDIDKFKRINDTLGHQLGDMLLNKIGSRLRTATRTLGLVSRMGGDEFALILRSAKKVEQIEVLCQKILNLVHKPIALDNHNIVASCSLGISLAGVEQSANDLIKNAEIAMYKAKEAGGNCFKIFSHRMAREAHVSLTLESEIHRAFENREFTLFLQPKVNMDSEIEGFESLVRWDHPDRGMLPPGEFIPAMENMGLISRLDDFILDTSCRQLKVLNQHFPGISVAVNISSTHFTDKAFLSYLKGCLQRYPIEPSCLELEITETLLMENMNVGMEIIQQIKELGVSIAIDDFGTGYSSLSYLKKLPVDTIKIDREFIKDIPDSESDMQISSVIIFLAKQLNFKVVAEGVETSEQMVFLKANHCDLAQGFYFSKPIPAHKAMILLESQRRDKKLNLKQIL